MTKIAHLLTVEELLRAKSNDIFPLDAVTDLLKQNGFTYHADGNGGKWIHPCSVEEIHISKRENTEHALHPKTIADISRILKAAVDKSVAIKQALKDHPDFDYECKDKLLRVFSKDYPEYGFTTKLSDGTLADTLMIRTLFIAHNDLDGIETLKQYKEALAPLMETMGYKRVRDHGTRKLVSDIAFCEPTELNAKTPAELMALLEQAKKKADDTILEQLAVIENLHTHGFHVAHNGELKLTHPNLKHTLEIPVFGDSEGWGWLNHDGWQKLQQIIKATDMEHKGYGSSLHVPSKPVRIAAENINDPDPKEAVIVMDSAGLVDLCTKRHDSKEDWTALLDETLRLPNVGKIIIPDYIADFEMLGIARHYDKNDKPHESAPINDKFHENRARFREFIRHAVRRHIDERTGQEIYLTQPGTDPALADQNIIIWETQKGREMGEDIHKMLEAGEVEAVRRKYWRDQTVIKPAYSHGELDKGEATIEEFTQHEIPAQWKSPVFIISSDRHYIDDPHNAPRTRSGQHKSYATTYSFIKAALEIRDGELTHRLHLKEKDLNTIYSQIFTELHRNHATPREAYGTCGLSDEADNIYALIDKGLKASQHQPRKPATHPIKITTQLPVIPDIVEEAPFVPPTREGITLGRMIAGHMSECSLDFKDLAAEVNKLNPHMPRTNFSIIQGITSGKIVVDDDHLYTLVVLLIDHNPKIADKDKEKATHEMIDAYNAVLEERKNLTGRVNRDNYHRLGDFISNKMEEIGETDYEEFARKIRRQARHILRPEERQIKGNDIIDIIQGKIPSAGLALALRKTLQTKGPWPEQDSLDFDRAYLSAQRPQESVPPQHTLQKVQEKVRSHFTVKKGKTEKPLSLFEIGKRGGITASREIGALLGKGGKVAFEPGALTSVGAKWEKWVAKRGPKETAPLRVQQFRSDYAELLEELDQQQLQR